MMRMAVLVMTVAMMTKVRRRMTIVAIVLKLESACDSYCVAANPTTISILANPIFIVAVTKNDSSLLWLCCGSSPYSWGGNSCKHAIKPNLNQTKLPTL